MSMPVTGEDGGYYDEPVIVGYQTEGGGLCLVDESNHDAYLSSDVTVPLHHTQ